MAQSEKKWWQGEEELRSTGQLVAGGGLSGAVMSVIYLLIGTAFWAAIGFGLDWLLGTTWLVWAGGLLGASAGVYLVYVHMRSGTDS